MTVFADTFFFMALLNRRDAAHERAVYSSSRLERIVTSTFVLIELADCLCDAPLRPHFRSVLHDVRSGGRIEVVPLHEHVYDEAVSLYLDRPDKEWSLTDCTSFVIMRERDITEALTGDHHFEQAGFAALLR